MSLITQAIIVEKYGMRLTVDQLAELMGLATNTLYNKIAAGKLEVPTYIDSGKRWCDFRDAAAYFDACRARAATQV